MTAPGLTGTFAMVDPEHVAQVGPAAAILFSRICWRAERANGGWRASRALLSQETGLTDAMIRTAVQVLRDREWVVAERTSIDDATLTWRPVLAGQPDIVESTPPHGEIRQDPSAESAMSFLETDVKQQPPHSPPEGGELFAMPPAPESKPPAVVAVVDRFPEWYDLYPRKKARAAAEKAWAQVTRKTDPGVIIDGLLRHLPSLRAKIERGDGRFVPYPASWLRAGCWEDEPEARQREPQAAYGSVLPTIQSTLNGANGTHLDPWAECGLDSPPIGGPLPINPPANERIS